MKSNGTASLTTSNLNLPEFRVKVTDRAVSFVRSQRAYSSAFAAEGRAFYDLQAGDAESTVTTDHRNPSPPNILHGVGFSSPILKARADRVQRTRMDVTVVPSRGDPIEASRVGINRMSNEVDSGTSKKRATSPDGEHAARLAERRGRKRAKRAIVNPDPPPAASKGEDSSEAEQENKETKRSETKKKKRKKKAKIDPGLALMQNFSATNVGQGRLTLKPGPSMGFFNKGKASAPTKTQLKKGKNKKDFTFSEAKFLNTTRPPSLYSHNETPSSASSISGSDENRRSGFSKSFSTHSSPRRVNDRRVQSKSNRRGRSSQSKTKKATILKRRDHSDIHVDPSENARGSEMWDIELEKSPPDGDGSENDQGEGASVILSTHPHQWELAGRQEPARVDLEEDYAHKAQDELSLNHAPTSFRIQSDILQHDTRSPSLAPSDSASQHIVELHSPDRNLQLVEPARLPQSTNRSNDDFTSRTPLQPPPFRFRPVSNPVKVAKFPVPTIADFLLYLPCVDDDSEDDQSYSVLPENLEADSEPVLFETSGQEMKHQFLDYPVPQWYDSVQDSHPEAIEEGYGIHWENGDFDEDIGTEHEDRKTYGSQNDCLDDDESYEELESQLGAWDGDDEDLGIGLMGGLGYLDGIDASEMQMDGSGQQLADYDPEWESEEEPRAASPAISFSRTDSPLQDLGSEPRFLFTQGRSLLFGVEDPIIQDGSVQMEGELGHTHDVTRSLKDHWLPQKL